MLTIALLISASGVDACVPTHGASMNLRLVPVKVKGAPILQGLHALPP